ASSARNLSGSRSAPLDSRCAFFRLTASRYANREPRMHRHLFVASALLVVACARPAASQTRPAATTLKDAYRDAFKLGVAINAATATGADSATQALVVREFNSITA